MVSFKARLAGLVLAVWFGVGCSTGVPLQKSDLSEQSFTVGELKANIRQLNKKIADSPANADLFYKKGFFLYELAKTQNRIPQKRRLYSQMNRSLWKAQKFYRLADNNAGEQKTDKLLQVSWSKEHNRGVQIIEQDSIADENDYENAAKHFHNATIILPDSVISYKLEAKMFFKIQHYQQAINALTRAQNTIDPLPAAIWEQLGFLYMQIREPQKAIHAYQKARAARDNLPIIHGLANAYISAGHHKKAIEVLDILIQKSSNKYIYYLAKGQELYFLGSQFLNNYLRALRNGRTVVQSIYREARSAFQKANKEFEKVLERTSQKEKVLKTVADSYQNIAAGYQQLLHHISDQRRTDIEQQITYYLSATIPLYKKLTQISGNNQTYWNQLYHAYRYLGMNKEAEKAKSRMK